MNKSTRPRTGAAYLTVAIVCMVVATLILTSLTETGIRYRRQIRKDTNREQAQWIVEGVTNLALSRLAENPDYQGEEFELTNPPSGIDTVKIQIEVNKDATVGGQLEVSVVLNGNSNQPVKRSRVVNWNQKGMEQE
ncbi:MAG: hypothetical protein AAF939_02395 [Planctomycetota bacterium]